MSQRSPEYESYLKTKAALDSGSKSSIIDSAEKRRPIAVYTPSKSGTRMSQGRHAATTPRSFNSSRRSRSPRPAILAKINGTRESISKINLKITEREVLKSNLVQLRNKHLRIEKKMRVIESQAKDDKSKKLKNLRSYALFKTNFDDKKMDELDCEKRIKDCEFRIKRGIKNLLKIRNSIEDYVDGDIRVATIYDEICAVEARARFALQD